MQPPDLGRDQPGRATAPAASTVQAEVLAGEGLSLSAAARLLPPMRNGRPVNPATLWRWARDGSVAPGGRRVFLEVARLGRGWVTTRSALRRYLDAMSQQPTHPQRPAPTSGGIPPVSRTGPVPAEVTRTLDRARI
jgi:hypothetical protein